MGFFKDLAEEFKACVDRYGDCTACRMGGRWVIYGSPEFVAEYSRLAVKGAKQLGFVGSDEEAIQYWMSHVEASRRLTRLEIQ